jgi:hypothetical protein
MRTIKPLAVLLACMSILIGPALAEQQDWNGQLQKALKSATKLRVRTGGICHRRTEEEKTLLEVGDPKDVAGFAGLIEIAPDESGFHCMCCGNPTLEFYEGDKLIVSLGYHHSISLRWAGGPWKGDGLLTPKSSEAIVRWLADRKVTGPKEEKEESLREQKKSEASREKWLKTMPVSLKPFWESMGNPMDRPNEKEMSRALEEQIPDPSERILVLLEWFGSGQGPWSGYPAYESTAEDLLLTFQTEEILGAIRKGELTPGQSEGAARLFGGWDFRRLRPEDGKKLDADLKKRFLEHSLKSDDEDKKDRAKAAFSP